MPRKKNNNLGLIILIALILGGMAYWGISHFNKSREPVSLSSGNEAATPQNPEVTPQTSMVEADKPVSNDTPEKGSKPPIDENTITPGKTNIERKPGNADKIGDQDPSVKSSDMVQGRIITIPDIDYKNLKKDAALNELMQLRKSELGFDKSLDMIVNSNESFKIGDLIIPLRDILEMASFKEGRVFQEKIEASGAVQPEIIKKFGIYVVQPGDNIWNIHFNILKEYYEHQGITISPVADEPISKGMSSGIGKILKFSETMVIIYNLIDQKIDTDIDLLEPLSKIIIYNMDEIFSLLQEVNYESIDRIQFDGKTIWVPAKKI